MEKVDYSGREVIETASDNDKTTNFQVKGELQTVNFKVSETRDVRPRMVPDPRLEVVPLQFAPYLDFRRLVVAVSSVLSVPVHEPSHPLK